MDNPFIRFWAGDTSPYVRTYGRVGRSKRSVYIRSLTEEAQVVVRQFMTDELQAMMECLNLQYGIPLSWTPKMLFQWRDVVKNSIGGVKNDVPIIRIAGCRYMNQSCFREYPHYSDDPEIGNWFGEEVSGECIHVYRILLAHELAHVVQKIFSNYVGWRDDFPGMDACRKHFAAGYEIDSDEWLSFLDAHGMMFQNVYRALRRDYVNHLLPVDHD